MTRPKPSQCAPYLLVGPYRSTCGTEQQRTRTRYLLRMVAALKRGAGRGTGRYTGQGKTRYQSDQRKSGGCLAVRHPHNLELSLAVAFSCKRSGRQWERWSAAGEVVGSGRGGRQWERWSAAGEVVGSGRGARQWERWSAVRVMGIAGARPRHSRAHVNT
eukprot:244204-Chlamydomonas_euryale.AAC.1